ncbi:uncharacterized [Tachysurus ichikawai]
MPSIPAQPIKQAVLPVLGPLYAVPLGAFAPQTLSAHARQALAFAFYWSPAGGEGLVGRGLCEHEGFCLDALLHFEHGWHPNCSGAAPLCTDQRASETELQEESAAWMDDLILARDNIAALTKECKLCSCSPFAGLEPHATAACQPPRHSSIWLMRCGTEAQQNPKELIWSKDCRDKPFPCASLL